MADRNGKRYLRGYTRHGCVLCEVPTPPGTSIKRPVGMGGANQRDDVLTVQKLLNGVPITAAAPPLKLAEDGYIGPRTTQAIIRYQKVRLGWSDGRVDPGGPTITRLVTDNGGSATPAVGPGAAGQSRPGGGAAPAASTPQEAQRLARAVAQIPRVKKAIDRALLRLDDAQGFCDRARQGRMDGTAFDQMGEGAWLIFAKHFGLRFDRPADGAPVIPRVRSVVFSMKMIYARGTNAFGGPIWGASIYAARPAPPNHTDWIAFTHTGGWHQGGVTSDGMREDTIFFCEGMDGGHDDLYLQTTVHELAHFVGDVNPPTNITDISYLDEEDKYNRMSSAQRLRNADSYANYVCDFTLGTVRLEELRGPNAAFLDEPWVKADGGIEKGAVSGMPATPARPGVQPPRFGAR